jgi:branched-subunit amino acid aminotransferase/4-amino-4-deoxychorismate lyase
MHTTLCYFNGDLIPYNEITLHVSDLQLQRGYGIFDFFRARNGKIPWLEDYTERVFNSLRLSEIDAEMTQDDFIAAIHRLHAKNGLADGAFKVIVTGGNSDTLESVTGPPNFIILNLPWKRPPAETYRDGVALVSYHFVRPEPEIKTLNYFNTMRLRRKMKEYDAVDVLFYTDLISEASRANLFFAKEGQLFTPAKNILYGITRKQVLEMFPKTDVTDISATMLYDFDEVFMASTSRDITPVVAVEDRTIGNGKPGPVTKSVQQAFIEKGWMRFE